MSRDSTPEAAALRSWTASWSPYTLVDEAGARRRLLKARLRLPRPGAVTDALELLAEDGLLLDAEPLPAGIEGDWAHGFWIPLPAGAHGAARLRWTCGGRAVAERTVTIPAPQEAEALPLRLDRMGAHLRRHLEAREEEARVVGPSGEWDAPSPLDRVSQHDVIYLRPATEWDEGLPIGNGNLGALVCGRAGEWQAFHLDKTDIWLASEAGAPAGRAFAATLRVGYRSQGPFHQRLSLAGGEVETQDGALFSCARVHALRNCLEVEIAVPRGTELTVCLERATVPLHPEKPNAAAALNGFGAKVSAPEELERIRRLVEQSPRTRLEWGDAGREVWLLHAAPNIRVAVAMRLLGGEIEGREHEDGEPSRTSLVVRAGDDGRLRLLAAVATDREAGDPSTGSGSPHDADEGPSRAESRGDPVAHARSLLDACGSAEEEAASHRAWWRRFWERSWIDLPDKFEENLWYLGVYNQACVSRGPQAVSFFGLWHPLDNRGWRDAYVADAQVPMMWWSCFATNHLDLLFPSHHTFGAVAVECAEHAPGAGMVVPHWFDPVWAGGHRAFTGSNPYKGSTAWFALNFWWDYLYTGDAALLGGLTYPLLRMAADYHAADLREEDDGRLHCHESGAPEQNDTARDNIYDWALLRALFEAAMRAAEVLDCDADRRARWRDLLERLFPMPGDGERAWESRDARQPYRCHPVMMMGLYPGTVAHGSPEFHAVRNTLPMVTSLFAFRFADRHDPRIPGHEGGVEPNAFSSGMLTIAQARLGEVEGYRRFLYGLIVRFHLKRNGLRALCDPRHADALCRASVVEGANSHTVAITETLLQSWPDQIRLFPCAAATGAYRFAGLRAFGGFVVSAQLEDGELSRAEIGSLCGGPIEIAWPWGVEGVSVEEWSGGSRRPVAVEWRQRAGETRLRFETTAGSRYRIGAGQAAAMRPPVPERRSAPRRIAVDEAEAGHGRLLHYPEDLPFGQVVEDAYLYLGNPSAPAEARREPDLEALAAAALSPDWGDRQQAARILGRAHHHDDEAIPLLVRLCGDAAAPVAQTAAVSLVRRGSERAVAEARRLARESSVPGLRREVEKALLRWRGEES